jgi:hypothetical protein
MAVKDITPERLRRLLDYDPATGLFRWRVTVNRSAVAGSVAGTPGGEGRVYTNIQIDGTKVAAHRLAFLYMTGAWPDAEVDHINGEGHDNRWENLRCATRAQNQQNMRKARSNNAGGVIGIRKRGKRWTASITADGKRSIHLGTFDDAESAHQAYLVAKREMHPFCTI